MDDFKKLFTDFIEHLKVKNYSPATITIYHREMRQFFIYLKEAGIADLKRVTRNTLNAYLTGIMERKNRGDYGLSTVSNKVLAAKRFFEYLEDLNYILINPAEHIKEPKGRGTRLPRTILTESEARKVLDQPNLSTMIGIRDRTILEVFYSTGIRLDEMAHLTIFDCDLQGGLLRVNKGKGAKDRVVPLGRHAIRFLKEYITKVRPHHTRNNKGHRILFVNQTGEPLPAHSIGKKVSYYAQQAGINKNVSPHILRHTFATQLVKNGAEITAVQKMLGHKDLSTTQIYTRVAGVEIKETHKKRHPREKDKEAKTPDAGTVELYFRVKPKDSLLIKRSVLSKQLQRKRHV